MARSTPRVAALCALLLAALAAGVGAVSPGEYDPDAQECAMLRRINDYRRRHGKDPLVLSRRLGAAADHHSEHMARKGYFGHDLKGGPSWSKNIRRHGYRGRPIGENIAAGYESAGRTFDQWRHSAGHRRNMLAGGFEAIGVGRAFDRGSRYGWYWTTTFGGGADRGDAARC